MPNKGKNTKQEEGKKHPSPDKKRLNLYMFYGNGVIWDKAKNKALCRFEKGKLLTTDIRTISILLKRRFRYKTKLPITKSVLNKAYSDYKKEIRASEKKPVNTGYDRKILNNMRITELKILAKVKKIRLMQEISKTEIINRLLGARR